MVLRPTRRHTHIFGQGYPTGVDKLENGEMVQVLALDDPYTSEQMLENEQGELQWIVLDEGRIGTRYSMTRRPKGLPPGVCK